MRTVTPPVRALHNFVLNCDRLRRMSGSHSHRPAAAYSNAARPRGALAPRMTELAEGLGRTRLLSITPSVSVDAGKCFLNRPEAIALTWKATIHLRQSHGVHRKLSGAELQLQKLQPQKLKMRRTKRHVSWPMAILTQATVRPRRYDYIRIPSLKSTIHNLHGFQVLSSIYSHSPKRSVPINAQGSHISYRN